MLVSLKEFKIEVSNAKRAVVAGPIDGATEYIMLQPTENGLRIGGRGAALSYTALIKYDGDAGFERAYVPTSAVSALCVKNTKDDVLALTYDESNGDLLFGSSDETGVVRTVVGLDYAKPYMRLTDVKPYVLLKSGLFLKQAIALVSQVKKGWSVSTRPHAAGFVRLALYDEQNFRDEEDAPEPQVCKFLLAPVTADQDKAVWYASGMALSVFASDDARYYQSFEPVMCNRGDTREIRPTSEILAEGLVGVPVHLLLNDAEHLGKLLKDEPYRVGILFDASNRPEACVIYNDRNFIWVRAALDNYPDEDFNRQLAFFYGEELASLTPNKVFINSIKAAVKISATGKHGLTVCVEDGKIAASSPESATVVRYGECEAKTYVERSVTVVDGNGFLSAINVKDEIKLIAGEDFLAIYNTARRSRVVLRNFMR